MPVPPPFILFVVLTVSTVLICRWQINLCVAQIPTGVLGGFSPNKREGSQRSGRTFPMLTSN